MKPLILAIVAVAAWFILFGCTLVEPTPPIPAPTCTQNVWSPSEQKWVDVPVPCGDTVRTGGLETSTAREARGGE